MINRLLLSIFFILSLSLVHLDDASAKPKKKKKKGLSMGDTVEVIDSSLGKCYRDSENGKIIAGSPNKKGTLFNKFSLNSKKKKKSKKLKKKLKALKKKAKKNPDKFQSKVDTLQVRVDKLSKKKLNEACQEAFDDHDNGGEGSGGGNEGGGGETSGNETLTKFTGTVTESHINTLCNVTFGCTPAQKTTLMGLRSQGIDAVVAEFMKVPSNESALLSDCNRYLDEDYDNGSDEDPEDRTFDGMDQALVCRALNGEGLFLEYFSKFIRSEMITLGYNTFDEGTTWHKTGLQDYANKIRTWVKAGLNGTGGSLKELAALITLDPVMLVWLDGNLNRKPSDDGTNGPNENFGREYKELFFQGTDFLCDPDGKTDPLYNSLDIAEISKALTGWRATGIGDTPTTLESPENRVEGDKTIFTQIKTGGSTVDTVSDIFDATFDDASVAITVYRFWAHELLRYFVDSSPSCADVSALANALATDGNPMNAMRALFTSTLFFESGHDAITRETSTFMVYIPRVTGIEMSVEDVTNEILSADRMWTRPFTVFYYLPGIHLNAGGTVVNHINFIQDEIADTEECRNLIADGATASEVISQFEGMLGFQLNSDQRTQLLSALDQDENTAGTQFSGTDNKSEACEIGLAAMAMSTQGHHH